MKYIIDMGKASADYDKFQNCYRRVTFANIVILGVAALCIAAMTALSIWRGITGVFNALLILLGLLVITAYVLTLFMKPHQMNARFYKVTRGGKLLGMSTISCGTDEKTALVVVSVEDEHGDVRQYNIGKVQKIENTRYSEPVLNLDDARMYIPYTGEHVVPEKIEEVAEAPVAADVPPVEAAPEATPAEQPQDDAQTPNPKAKKNKKSKNFQDNTQTLNSNAKNDKKSKN